MSSPKIIEHRFKSYNLLIKFHILKRYDLIIQCWNASPEKRPFFEDLVEEIDSLLEGVAGYLEFSAFSSKV